MYLGLDLRGGVRNFLLQVDMAGALTKRLDATAGDLRTQLRDKTIRHTGIAREGNTVVIDFRDDATRQAARQAISDFHRRPAGRARRRGEFKLIASPHAAGRKTIQEFAIKQNITTLHNRINELGVAEPVIQQQGADRIVVQLPGCRTWPRPRHPRPHRDPRSAHGGRHPGALEGALNGTVPFGTELATRAGGSPLLVKKQVVLTGDRLTDAQPGFDGQTHEPAVHLTLDAAGARIFRDVTRENVGKRMAILLIEKGKGSSSPHP